MGFLNCNELRSTFICTCNIEPSVKYPSNDSRIVNDLAYCLDVKEPIKSCQRTVNILYFRGCNINV